MTWTDPPRTWVAGEKPSAATLNTHIRDQFKAIGDPWTAFAPAWTGSIGNGVITASFEQAGATVRWSFDITAGSTTNFAGGTGLTLPVARPSGKRIVFVGIARIGSSSFPIYADAAATSNTVTLRADPTIAGNALRTISATIPGSFAAGDTLSVGGTYEAG